jgi:hypothetical protein
MYLYIYIFMYIFMYLCMYIFFIFVVKIDKMFIIYIMYNE